MERHRLKTVMILILALMNGFLLIHLARMYALDASASRRAREQLAALFTAQGIDLSPGVLSRKAPPGGLRLDWADSPEDSLAAFFLPAEYETREEDGARICTDGKVTVKFTGEGRFAVTGLNADGLSLCRSFCRQFGFRPPTVIPVPPSSENAANPSSDGTSGELPAVTEGTPESPPDSTYEAVPLYGGRTVCNCRTVFVFTEGKLREVSGVLLPSTAVPDTREIPLLNTAAALSAFLSQPRESAVSTILRLEPCFALRTGEAPALDPAWRIVTDGEDYYVNCVDGSVFLS